MTCDLSYNPKYLEGGFFSRVQQLQNLYKPLCNPMDHLHSSKHSCTIERNSGICFEELSFYFNKHSARVLLREKTLKSAIAEHQLHNRPLVAMIKLAVFPAVPLKDWHFSHSRYSRGSHGEGVSKSDSRACCCILISIE